MNNMWFFGCSHTTKDFNLSEMDKCWTTILAENLGYNEKNLAKSGASNDYILNTIIDNINNIDQNDFIVVMMTQPERILYEGKNLLPSEKNSQWWFKVVNDKDFYRRNFLSNLLSIILLLENKNKIITFCDLSLLLTNLNNYTKKIIKQNTIFLPKITLSKSYPLGEDGKHLSPEGHKMIAKFLINSTNESN